MIIVMVRHLSTSWRARNPNPNPRTSCVLTALCLSRMEGIRQTQLTKRHKIKFNETEFLALMDCIVFQDHCRFDRTVRHLTSREKQMRSFCGKNYFSYRGARSNFLPHRIWECDRRARDTKTRQSDTTYLHQVAKRYEKSRKSRVSSILRSEEWCSSSLKRRMV